MIVNSDKFQLIYLGKGRWTEINAGNDKKFISSVQLSVVSIDHMANFSKNAKKNCASAENQVKALIQLELLNFYEFKVEFLPSGTAAFIFFNESSLKIMKDPFYFMLKALSVLEIFKFLSWLFNYLEKWLVKKAEVNFTTHDVRRFYKKSKLKCYEVCFYLMPKSSFYQNILELRSWPFWN